MKNIVLAFACLISLLSGPLKAAETSDKSGGDRFYGKITAIDYSQKNVTVHNKKKNMDERFQWSEQTKVTSNKKSIPVTELKIGQSLAVAYITENDLNKANKITVRQPFKKSQP